MSPHDPFALRICLLLARIAARIGGRRARGFREAAAGIVCGVVAAWWLTRLLSGLLFGVTAMDPLTFGAVSGAILLVTALSCYVPARRAVHADPLITLKANCPRKVTLGSDLYFRIYPKIENRDLTPVSSWADIGAHLATPLIDDAQSGMVEFCAGMAAPEAHGAHWRYRVDGAGSFQRDRLSHVVRVRPDVGAAQ